MEASIVISGGGIIGNYISLRLSKSNISSVIIEKSEESFSNGEGIRTLTLNDQSLMMLKDIGINPLSSPINEINVMDGEGTGKIQFSSKDISTNSLSHVVVFNDLRDELLDLCKEKTIFNSEVEAIQTLNDELDPEILISNGETIKAKLLAGCDGRNSNVAKIASLSNQTKDYLQTAVTFIVDVKDAEEEVAYQVFSERGIFALMPMPKKNSIKNRHTVVWSINNSELKDISIENYVKNNLPYFESKLSLSMSIDSESLSFRLSNHYFENYISGPVVLIGDAAHSIHPLAGQGINLGFADADIFCEEIINSYNKGFALNDKTVLKRYEIRRKGMNLVMLKSMDFFVNFFNTNNLYLRLLRNWGLNSVNKTKFIKTFFIKHASGLNKF